MRVLLWIDLGYFSHAQSRSLLRLIRRYNRRVKALLSFLTGIKRNRLRDFVFLYVYFFVGGILALYFNVPLYVLTLFGMLIPAVYLAYRLHREGRFILESVIFALPAILTIDLVGHISRSWDYWRSEMFGLYIGPYPFIAFFWGFSFWFLIVTIYEYFYDRSFARSAPRSERRTAFLATILTTLFLIFYDGWTIPHFYAFLVAICFSLNLFLLLRYKYPFWKTYLPVLGLLPLAFLHEYVSLELGHWIFEPGVNFSYLSFFGHSIPLEEVLWFLVIHHSVILFHETYADNGKF